MLESEPLRVDDEAATSRVEVLSSDSDATSSEDLDASDDAEAYGTGEYAAFLAAYNTARRACDLACEPVAAGSC
jgi:hypothetical protein